ncbi:hypothetical protein [Dyella sp. 20L07]|uniref:hypothetical protein n=1 Tax=Dyella sp. 20L07 TaxID=3384240 RepID=UPI003D29CF13
MDIAGLSLPAGTVVHLSRETAPTKRHNLTTSDVASIELPHATRLLGAVLEGTLSKGLVGWGGTLSGAQTVQGMSCVAGHVAFRENGWLFHCLDPIKHEDTYPPYPPKDTPVCAASNAAGLPLVMQFPGDKPASNERYLLTRPDGSHCVGTTDDKGTVTAILIPADARMSKARNPITLTETYSIAPPGLSPILIEFIGSADKE